MIFERRAGEMLKETEKNPGVRGNIQDQITGSNTVLPPVDVPTLEDLGISKMQSHRWQLEAGRLASQGDNQIIRGNNIVTSEIKTLKDYGITKI